MSSHSISDWIAALKEQDADAAQKLWERFASRLISLARHELGNAPKGVADEEDIALSVFHSICCGAAAGRFENVRTRDNLWWLLISIVREKAINHVRRETAAKRGGGRLTYGSIDSQAMDGTAFTLDWLVGDDPTPDFLVMLEEENRRLLGKLRNDQLRRIAVSRISGSTVAEIAADLAISVRSVERKLQLIRKAWEKDLLTTE